MYMYQLPISNTITMYRNYVLIKKNKLKMSKFLFPKIMIKLENSPNYIIGIPCPCNFFFFSFSIRNQTQDSVLARKPLCCWTVSPTLYSNLYNASTAIQFFVALWTLFNYLVEGVVFIPNNRGKYLTLIISFFLNQWS